MYVCRRWNHISREVLLTYEEGANKAKSGRNRCTGAVTPTVQYYMKINVKDCVHPRWIVISIATNTNDR